MPHFDAPLLVSLFSTYPIFVMSRRRKHPNICLVKVKESNSANVTYKKVGCYNTCCPGQENGCCPWYTLPIIFVCTMTLLCLVWLMVETFWKWRKDCKRGSQTSIADDSSAETMLMISTHHQLPSTSGGGFQNQNYGSNSRQSVLKSDSLPTYEEATSMQ